MNLILRYSGVFVIFFSWVIIVFPYYSLKNKRKVGVLSDVGALSKIGWVSNIGVMLVSISQFIFWIYIFSIFPKIEIFRSLLILSYASLHLLLAGIIHRGTKKAVHDLLIHIYFVFSLVGAYLLSSAFSVIDMKASYLLRVLMLVSFLGMIFFYKKGKSIFVEFWHITFCSVWIVVIYLCIF